MRKHGRKRSAAITLVLAGSATLGGCGSPVEQRDAYSSLQSCVKDWSNSSLCEPVKDGKYASSYVYGPPYYSSGSGWNFFGRSSSLQSSPNAMDAQRLQNGSVASSPKSQMAMRMGLGPSGRSGSGSGSSSVSRGGFGSSGASSSSS